MSDDPLSVHTADSVGRVRDLFAAFGIHAVPVMEDGRAVGMLTTADLADSWPDEVRVGNAMTSVPHRIGGDESVGSAARQMLERRVHHLIVDEPDGTIGILSSFDLLRVLASDTSD